MTANVSQTRRPGSHDRIDRFVRESVPCVLRLVGYNGAADLLAGLVPFADTRNGRHWRSVASPLERHVKLLRADVSLLHERLRGTPALDELRRAGSDAAFIAARFPGIHDNVRLVLTEIEEAPSIARLVAESVRQAIVHIMLSSPRRHVGDVPPALERVDRMLAAQVSPRRIPNPKPDLEALIAAYLSASTTPIHSTDHPGPSVE